MRKNVRKISTKETQLRFYTRVGIVDLGTNSVRFAIYDIIDPLKPTCLYKKKLMLRPGQGVYDTGKMKSGTIKKLSLAFARFRRKLERFQAQRVKAVATSAVREAKNAPVLIRQIKKNSQIDLEVISGGQEARLIAEGLLFFDPPQSEHSVLIDIGGGSTEVSRCLKQKREASLSLPLGALRLQQIYFPSGSAGPMAERIAGLTLLRQDVQKLLSSRLKSWPNPRRPAVAIGSSGTIRAIARLLDRQRQKHRFSRLWLTSAKGKPRLHFKKSELKTLVEKMLPLSKAQLLRIPGMESRRVDIILAGAVLLLEVLEFLQIERVQTSNHALRDGLLLQLIPARKKF